MMQRAAGTREPSRWRHEFERILNERLIPEFCDAPERDCEVSGFRKESIKVAECDARDFVQALTGGLIRHQQRGLYWASRSAASEQFFWTGPKQPIPRSFTLWLEPIITVAALARLHRDFGWPADQIGTQSSDWAFDVVAFRPDSEHEHIAGEVKKSATEIDQLIELMQQFGGDPKAAAPKSGKALNAFRKVKALRARRAPLFWAVGPGGISKPHRVEYGSDATVRLVRADEGALRFETNGAH